MNSIKVLGTGCPTCQRLLNDVESLVENNNWNAEVEYITEIANIMSYGIMSTPALVVDEKVLFVGYPGASKVAKLLKNVLPAR